MNHKILFLFLFHLLLMRCPAQNPSYSIQAIDNAGNDYLNYDQITLIASQNPDLASFLTFYQGKTGLGVLTGDGTFEASYKLSKKEQSIITIPLGYQRFQSWHYISVEQVDAIGNINNYNGIIAANFNTNTYWGLKTHFPLIDPPPLIISTKKQQLFTSHFWAPGGTAFANKIGIAQINPNTGNCLSSFFFDKMETAYTDSYYPLQIIETSNNNLLILGDRYFSTHKESYLLKIAPDGAILNNANFPVDSINVKSICNDQQNNTYAIGLKNPISNRTAHTAFVSKIDQNMELLWAKEIPLENFLLRNAKISMTDDGNLYLVLFTYEKLNTVIMKMSATGDIIWQKAFHNLIWDVSLEGSSIFLVSSTLDYQGGQPIAGTLILKTNAEGEIEGCASLPSCLYSTETSLQLTKSSWRRFTAQLLPNFEIETSPLSFSSVNYCPNPNLPIPYFTFPDTLCQHSCAAPDSLVNALADYNEWHIQGPGLDTIITDSSFYWCFTTPGNYQIEQTTWLLGCEDSYIQQIEIISDDINLSLGEDRVICDAIPFRLQPNARHHLISYNWQDSSQLAYLDIHSSGNYTLRVSDGYCIDSASVSLILPQATMKQPFFSMALDTTVCIESLPLQLFPQSDYSEDFLFDGTSVLTNNIPVNTPGHHLIGFNYQDCYFEENFNLHTIPCPADIYLPNVFSPNDDGINDYIEALGDNFIPLQIQVFNRWGDLIFQSDTAPFRWDGTYHGKKLSPDVFVLQMKYLNLKTQQQHIFSQDLLLIR